MVEEDDKYMVGSFFLVEATREEAQRFIENDPFMKVCTSTFVDGGRPEAQFVKAGEDLELTLLSYIRCRQPARHDARGNFPGRVDSSKRVDSQARCPSPLNTAGEGEYAPLNTLWYPLVVRSIELRSWIS